MQAQLVLATGHRLEPHVRARSVAAQRAHARVCGQARGIDPHALGPVRELAQPEAQVDPLECRCDVPVDSRGVEAANAAGGKGHGESHHRRLAQRHDRQARRLAVEAMRKPRTAALVGVAQRDRERGEQRAFDDSAARMARQPVRLVHDDEVGAAMQDRDREQILDRRLEVAARLHDAHLDALARAHDASRARDRCAVDPCATGANPGRDRTARRPAQALGNHAVEALARLERAHAEREILLELEQAVDVHCGGPRFSRFGRIPCTGAARPESRSSRRPADGSRSPRAGRARTRSQCR
jgi:hypothetical protein